MPNCRQDDGPNSSTGKTTGPGEKQSRSAPAFRSILTFLQRCYSVRCYFPVLRFPSPAVDMQGSAAAGSQAQYTWGGIGNAITESVRRWGGWPTGTAVVDFLLDVYVVNSFSGDSHSSTDQCSQHIAPPLRKQFPPQLIPQPFDGFAIRLHKSDPLQPLAILSASNAFYFHAAPALPMR